MSLIDLPTDLTNLIALTKHMNLYEGMLDNGTSLETHLRLYLSNNLFTQLPNPVLQLTNLRVLSLRQNKIKRIPPAIRQLVNLQSLNVSANELEYLPYEVWELVKERDLKEILSEPNPWRQPTEKEKELVEACSNAPVGSDYSDVECSSVLIARTPHQTLDVSGALDLKPAKFGRASTGSGVAPLAELVLRQLLKLNAPLGLAECMPTDSPDTVLDMLNILEDARDGRRCNTCQRAVVVPRRTWIEWRGKPAMTGLGENVPCLPYLKMACRDMCQEGISI